MSKVYLEGQLDLGSGLRMGLTDVSIQRVAVSSALTS